MFARLILFCLTLDYNKILIPSLVENGFKVSSGFSNNKLGISKGISNCINLDLESIIKDPDLLCEKIISILNECKIYYYGFVVVIGSATHTKLGNIDGETDITRVMKMKALW